MRYTPDEKKRALDCLERYGGNWQRTSAETGIAIETLKRWQREREAQQTELAAAFIHKMRLRLAESAVRLVDALERTINVAPLNQLASALGVVIDRYLKFEELVPQDEARETIIRHDYRYPDGSIHNTPPWAADGAEYARAFSGGGLWAALGQDADGQDGDSGARLRGEAVLVARSHLPDGEPGVAGLEDGRDERVWYDG